MTNKVILRQRSGLPELPITDFVKEGIRQRGGGVTPLSRSILGGLQLDLSDIAIVGNSGILIGAGRGAEIDRHATVMRFNQFVTNGFERDTGSKTTVMFLAETVRNEKVQIYTERLAGTSFNIITKLVNSDFLESQSIEPSRVHFMCSSKFFTRKDVYKIVSQRTGGSFSHPFTPRSGVVVPALLCSDSPPGKPFDLYGVEVRDVRSKEWKTQYYNERASGNYKHLKWHCPVELEFEMLIAMQSAGVVRIID